MQEIRTEGYPQPNDIASVAKLARGKNAVIAKVETVGAARWNTSDGQPPPEYTSGVASAPVPHHIFTPIDVTVEESINGSLKRGEQIVIRGLSGTVGQYRFSSDDWPGAEVYQPGQRVLLILNDFVDAGDGLVASTPNFVYLLSGDDAKLWNGKSKLATKSVVDNIKAEANLGVK